LLLKDFCAEFLSAVDDELAKLETPSAENGEPPRHDDHHGEKT
jgi:hypothetical protein